MINSSEFDKLKSHMASLLAGEIPDVELVELQSILDGSTDARKFYVEHLLTDALLSWCHDSAAEQFVHRIAPIDGARQLPFRIPVGDPTLIDCGDERLSANGQRKLTDLNRKTSAMRTEEASGRQHQADTASGSRKSPIVLGSLGSFGSAVASHPVVFGVFLLAAIGLTSWLFSGFRALAPSQDTQRGLATAQADQIKSVDVIPKGNAVKFVAGLDCEWVGSENNPVIGADLPMGQTLHLLTGVAQIRFGVGVNVLVQSPADFAIESANSLRIDSGKLTAEILTEQGRGFTVITDDATYVDQGTEFGVDVTHSGNSSLHVFKGAVDVALNSKSQPNLPIQRLKANEGARFDDDLNRIMFVEDTGETFIRSLDDAERDQHVIAYWRFEDHPIGTLVPDSSFNQKPVRGTVDSSYNSNDLFTYSPGNQPTFCSDVPKALVPQTGRLNQSCLDNTEPPSNMPTRDLYTWSEHSHAAPIDIEKISPAKWTIEASVKVKLLKGFPQTFVAREGSRPKNNVPVRLAFQLNGKDKFAIHFMDKDGRAYSAVAENLIVEACKWYNLAAVSDGHILRLYVDSIDGQGYKLAASTELSDTGSTALGGGAEPAEWTIGRGKSRGQPSQWFEGWIDEVRVSDIALKPSDFLFSEPSANISPQDVGDSMSKSAK